MRDVREALEALKDLTGLSRLAFDANGRAELVIEEAVSIYLVRVSDVEIEVAAHFQPDQRQPTNDELRNLLRANADLEDDDARFALDVAGIPFLCQRIDVRSINPGDLDRVILDFAMRVSRLRHTEKTP